MELRSDIADSRGLMDKSSLKCSHMPALEQPMKLQTLGLSGEHVDDGIFDIDENSRN